MLGADPRPGQGARFSVWAPRRREVAVEWQTSDGRRAVAPMSRDADGVWRATVAEAGPGTLYAYRVDGQGPFPDPYARALPEGVHGRAEIVDPGAFGWTDAGWTGITREGLVIYELHVGTFTAEGTFDAVIGELDELRALGVGAIELMPISSFPGRWNWGYDGVGHYAPDASYGGPEALQRLVDAAHARGIGVILDVVYNHLGPSGNYLRVFADEYFTDRHKTPWGDALNYDGPDSQRVRDWAIENAVYWVREYHVDGFRLDATHAIHDEGPVHLLRELSQRVRSATERRLVLIAEDESNDVRMVRSAGRGGYGLDAVWADDFHHALRTLITSEREGYYANYAGHPREVGRALRQGFVYTGQHRATSGGPRGRPTGRTPASAFVFCSENHDQVGNRALGERLAHLVSPGVYRAASALLLLAPETPMLFMGQEFAASTPFLYFTDHDPELGRLVTEGRRSEFAGFSAFAGGGTEGIPDPQDEATFGRSKLRLEERREHDGVYRLYRDLLRRRREDPVVARQDRFSLRSAPLGERALLVVLGAGAPARILVANFGDALDAPLPAVAPIGGRWRAAFSTDAAESGGAGGAARIENGRVRVPAETAVFFAPDGG